MSIKRNTIYNIGGALVPLALTIVSVPLYLQAIGEARYGLLALIWLLLGYFGLFDLGLSTATANAIARSRSDAPEQRPAIFMTSLVANAALGLAIGASVLLLGPVVLGQLPNVSPTFRAEILRALPWLATIIPLVTLSGVFAGVLTAHERFGTVNIVGIGGTVLFQLAPLFAAYGYGPDLGSIVPAAIAARAVPILLLGVFAIREVPLRGARFDLGILRVLLAFGGWVMVTNLISPILVSADQFVIATFLGAGAVAHYSVAYSLAVRLQILPGSLVNTIFPRLSALNSAEAQALAGHAMRMVMIVMTTVCVPVILVVRPFMIWWLGADFAQAAAPVAEILIVSIWINGLAFVPLALVQAQGRPSLVAKYHLLEVPPFMAALFVGIYFLGLEGAAFAWAGRVALDTVLLGRASKLSAANLRTLAPDGAIVALAWLIARSGWASSWGALVIAVATGATLVLLALRRDPMLRNWARSLAVRMRLPWPTWLVGV